MTVRSLLYRLRAPLIVPKIRGDRAARLKLRFLDALLDVLDLPAVWRQERYFRVRRKRLKNLERQIAAAVRDAEGRE